MAIDQGDRAVLHLRGRVALGVDVADFLELQRALQGGGKIVLAAQEQEVVAGGVLLRDPLHPVVALQRLADFLRQLLQLLDDAQAGRDAQVPQRPKYKASIASTVHCEVKALVEATPISGPARR